MKRREAKFVRGSERLAPDLIKAAPRVRPTPGRVRAKVVTQTPPPPEFLQVRPEKSSTRRS